jgi:hypothetical protein
MKVKVMDFQGLAACEFFAGEHALSPGVHQSRLKRNRGRARWERTLAV